MIIVKISGGLGNQLFQYSFGRFLSIKFNAELKFDLKTKYNSSNFTNRSIGLEKFNIAVPIATKKEIYKFKFFPDGFGERSERKIIQKFPFFNRKFVIQSSNKFENNIKSIRDNCYYDGYWQSEKYFAPIESILRNEIQLESKLDDKNVILLSEMNNSESISIHIRRGDYISIAANNKIFSICSIEYYENAIKYFETKIKNPIFFIFSDDNDWTKKNFKGEQFRIVDNNLENPEIDLFLMSQCRHNIIANSSFSWWGAWLNLNKDKKVIAPSQWYKKQYNDASLEIIPSKWIKM